MKNLFIIGGNRLNEIYPFQSIIDLNKKFKFKLFIYTENLRLWLLRALPKYGVKKFVDAACGDFNWMRMVVPQLDIEYQGFDIVDRVIEQNIAKYSNENAPCFPDLAQGVLRPCFIDAAVAAGIFADTVRSGASGVYT